MTDLTALVEHGLSPEEAADTATALVLWRVPPPDPAQVLQLTARLRAAVTSQRKAATQPSTTQQLLVLLRIAQVQVRILRPEFWLSSAAVVSLGAVVSILRPDAQRSLLLYLLGPLVGYCAVATAFGGTDLGLLECELACPPSPRQLIVARLVIVLAYTSALGLCLSVALGWTGAGELTLSWLAPLLVEVGTTLVLSLRVQAERAAAVTYGTWATLLAIAWAGSYAPPTPAVSLNMVLVVAGLCAIGFAIFALPRQLVSQTSRIPA